MIRRRGRRWLTFSKKESRELLPLTETKLKGKGEVSRCGVNSIITDVQEMERAREGVAVTGCGTAQWYTLGVLALECSGLNSNF